MNNEEERQETRPPRRGRGPGRGMSPGEKPKDFKKAIGRLIKELGIFKYFILIAVLLSVASSVISIITPDKLANLTDKISAGIIINGDNLQELIKITTKSMESKEFTERVEKILSIDLSQENIQKIMLNENISTNSKATLQEVLINISKDPSKFSEELSKLDDDILKELLKSTTYNNIEITSNDKVTFIKSLNKLREGKAEIPTSIKKVLFDEVEVTGVKLSSSDQADFLTILSSIGENTSKDKAQTELYKLIDEMPESIRKVIAPKMDLSAIKKISLMLVVLYLISAFFSFTEHILMANVSNRFAYNLRKRISKKINNLPLNYFDNHTTGNTMSIVTNDIDTITQSLNQSAASLVSAITLLLGSIIMMFKTNVIMALTGIGASLFGFLFVGIILSKSQKYFVARQKELGNLNGHIEEMYESLNIIKTYNGKKYADSKFDKYNQNMYKANFMSQFLSGLMPPMMGFIGNFGYVAVCIVGALLTMNGTISFGVIVAFMSYIRLFTNPLNQIAQGLNSLQSGAAASERVFEYTDEKEMENEENLKEVLSKEDAKGNIEFKNVKFTYEGNDHPTIKGFSANVKSGQKIAIVGPTGAGKTTMVNLLMKFYDIDSGDILIDGKSIKNLTRDNIHELFTMVLQDTWLFEGTVKENIKYNKEELTDRDIEKVCEIVGLDHYIKTLPKGYNSEINNANSVSAGERQLLTIARAMLENSPFLILDEATSNVDTRTEEVVQMAMDKLAENRTSFIIAHRLSTIKNADLILVMNHGDVVEQGTHEELMEQKGFYSELYNSQFEL